MNAGKGLGLPEPRVTGGLLCPDWSCLDRILYISQGFSVVTIQAERSG